MYQMMKKPQLQESQHPQTRKKVTIMRALLISGISYCPIPIILQVMLRDDTVFVEPVSTPISHSIHKSVIKNIQTNKFVDFVRLLPNMALTQSENFSLTLNA
jgi:hypothetical protein